MRKTLLGVLFVLLAGCGYNQPKCQLDCVHIGGGELQRGLNIDLGCGQFVVNTVVKDGNNNIGFTVSTFPHGFYVVQTANDDVCSTGNEFISRDPIQMIYFCTDNSAQDSCQDTTIPL